MISNHRRQYSNHIGKTTEKLFVSACEQFGYCCEKTNEYIDIHQHIDYFIKRTNGTQTSVDVKGGNHPNLIWVEFKNVLGEKGWMYGEAEKIAFDMPEINGFILVDRIELLDYCKQTIQPIFVSKLEATRKLYQRENRKDVISRLTIEDLKTLKSYKVINYANT